MWNICEQHSPNMLTIDLTTEYPVTRLGASDDPLVKFSGLHVTEEMLAALGPREHVVFSMCPTVSSWPDAHVEKVTVSQVFDSGLWRGDCHAKTLCVIESSFEVAGYARELINFFKRHTFNLVELSLGHGHRMGVHIGRMKRLRLFEMTLDFMLSDTEHLTLDDCHVSIMRMPRIVSLEMQQVTRSCHKPIVVRPQRLVWKRVEGMRLAPFVGAHTQQLCVVDTMNRRGNKFKDLPEALPALELLMWDVQGVSKPVGWTDSMF